MSVISVDGILVQGSVQRKAFKLTICSRDGLQRWNPCHLTGACRRSLSDAKPTALRRSRFCRGCVPESITGDVAGAGVTATAPLAEGGAVRAGDAPVTGAPVVDKQAVRAGLTGIAVRRGGVDRRGVNPVRIPDRGRLKTTLGRGLGRWRAQRYLGE